METPMLKRRLNPFLLASTVLVLSLLAGLAVTWQGQLSNLVEDKRNLSSTLEQKNQEISSLESEVANLTEESSTLKSDVSDLNALVSELNATIDTKDAKIADLENSLDDREQRIDKLNSSYEELESNYTDLEDDLLVVCSSEEESGNITDTSETICSEHFGDGYE